MECLHSLSMTGRINLLFIARDRLGIRPLFYMHKPGSAFVFASEIKSIFQFPGIHKSVNSSALIDYTRNRYVSNPETIYEGMMKLEPGSYLLYTQGQLSKEEVLGHY